MRKIYIARHGQDGDNVRKILNGRRDEPLTELGVQQAEDMGRTIKEHQLVFDAVYASPLQRALRTAQIIARASDNPEPVVLPDLIERDFGVMTSTPIDEIKERCAPDILETNTITYFLNPEGAETFPELIQRGKRVLEQVAIAHPEGSVLLVTHGDIGKMIYAAYYDVPWDDVLRNFHFGNTEVLLLSEDSPASESHVFKVEQHNH